MNDEWNPYDADEQCWFVLLDDVETGPVSARTLHQYYRFDRVTDDTRVRKADVDTFCRIGDCPELLALLSKMNLERFSSIPPSKNSVVISVPPPTPSAAPPISAPEAPPISVPEAPPISAPEAPPISAIETPQAPLVESEAEPETEPKAEPEAEPPVVPEAPIVPVVEALKEPQDTLPYVPSVALSSIPPLPQAIPVSVTKTPPLPYRLTPPISRPPASPDFSRVGSPERTPDPPSTSPAFSSVPAPAVSSAPAPAFSPFYAEGAYGHELRPGRKPSLKSSPAVLLTSSGFFAVSLVILGILLFRDDKNADLENVKACEPQPVKTVEKIVEVEKIVYRDCVPDENPEPAFASNAKHAAVSPHLKSANAPRKSAEKKHSSDEKTSALMAQMGVSTPSSGAPVGSFGKAAAASSKGASSGGETGGLTPEQMKRVVDKNRSSLKTCYERSLKKGEAPGTRVLRVNFKVKVGQHGMVKRTDITGAGASLPNLKECLTRSVQKWVFPAAPQDSHLEFPFVFSPTG